jgi:hypothetical protein
MQDWYNAAVKPFLTIQAPHGGGYRTWRLALAFFGGLGGALLIVDYLAVSSARAVPQQGPRRAAFAVFAWPLAHLVVIAMLAYAPAMLRVYRWGFKGVSSRRFYPGLVVVCALLYSSGVWASCSVLSRGHPRARWGDVVEQIRLGELVADDHGVVQLPAQMKNATVDGNAHVTVAESGRKWVLFCIWRGKGASLIGYLYTGGDALTGSAKTSVTMDNAGRIGSAEVTLESDLGDSWYRVFRDLD